MYKISIFNNNIETVIHYPNPDASVPHVLQAPYIYKLSESTNVTLRVPFGNPGFNNIFPYTTLVKVTDLRDNELVFEGRAIYPQKKMETSGEHYIDWICEDELSYLNDTHVRDWNLIDAPVMDFLSQVINNHNSLSSTDKQFTLGTVEITGNVTYQCNFETSLGVITDQLINNLGGEIQFRKQGGVRYLDYVNSVGQTNTTTVELSKNMLDMMLEQNDTDKFGTRLIPIGKDNLNIKSVNGGLDYIQDANTVSEFGVIEVVVQYKDITDPAVLLAKATQDLPNYTQVLNKFECSVVDLNKLTSSVEAYGLGDDVPFTNPLFGMNKEYYKVIEINGDFTQPQSPKLTFANRLGRMTVRMQQIQTVSSIIQGLLSNNNQIATYFLDGAINALKNQLVASGAYQHAQVLEGQGVLFENTDPTSPDYGALYLGPGIFSIANSKVNGSWDWRTFGTGAGFVADLITAGTLLADRIAGGTLSSLDNSFKISLAAGMLTTFGTDNGYKSLELQNRTITWYDFINSGQKIGQIETERELDGNGNATGLPRLAIGIKQGAKLTFSDMDNGGKAILVIDNNASDSSKKTGILCLDNFIITNNNSTGGVMFQTGSNDAITLYGSQNCNGHTLNNVGNMNMSTGVGTSANGWDGTFDVTGASGSHYRMIFTKGVLTDIQNI